jgi:heat shock protein HslJ
MCRTWLLIAVLVLAGCDKNPAAPSLPPIQGVTWKLELIERAGNPTITIANPEVFTLVFEADGRLNARADCNTCNGRYSLTGTSLTTTPLACTRAFCGTAIDVAYATALGEARQVTVNGSQLLLQASGLTLRFRN